MRRTVLIVLGLLLVLALAGAFVLRSMLDPDVLRTAAESRLSELLGQPVSIGNVRVSLLPVPSAMGSRITIGSNSEAPELALDRIRIVPRTASLFRGPYVIRDVILEGLTVRIVREPPGRWKFPSVVPVAGGGEETGVIIERVRLTGGRVLVLASDGPNGVRQTSSIDEIEGEAVTASEGLRISPLRGRVGRSDVSGSAAINAGEVTMDFSMPAIANADLGLVLGLAATDAPDFVKLVKPAAVKMSIQIDRAKSRLTGAGSLRAPGLAFYSLQLDGLESPIKTDGVRVTFVPATFAIYGGSHRGSMVVDLSRSPARWVLDSTISNVDVSRFLSALTGQDQKIDGIATTRANLHAGVGDPMPASLQGRATVNVVNGVVREFPLLAAVNRALRLAEGSSRDTRFERLSATFTFAGGGGRTTGDVLGYGTTNDLVMVARDMRVEAAGRVGFNRSLELAGQAVLSRERSAEAIRSIRELTGLRNERGELELPIQISGTLDDPSFSLDLKAAVGRSLKEELRRRLRDIIRRYR